MQKNLKKPLKNILIFNWRDPKNPKSGGAEISTLEHAREWIRKGNRVTWFSPRFKNSAEKELIDGIHIIRRGNFISVYFWAPIFFLFSKQKFDLVIDEIHGIPFFTPFYVRIPKIAFIHEVADEIWDYMYPFPINKIGRIIEPLLLFSYRNVKFMTVSNSTKKSLIKVGIKEKKITVINNGIKNKPLNSLPDKEKVPTFIFVSRVVRMKGIEEVIRSFFHILKEIKDAQLWIVGDGDPKYLEKLRKTISSYSITMNIIFFGKVSENKKLLLMRKAHVLLHASIKEGWGIVVVEAASQATPAVVYNVAGLRDSVINNKTGAVLNENSSVRMAIEAVSLYKDKDKYKNFQKNALEWARSLDWENSTRQSVLLINSFKQDE